MKNKKSTQNLVCYLFKDNIKSFSGLFKVTNGMSAQNNFEEISLKKRYKS